MRLGLDLEAFSHNPVSDIPQLVVELRHSLHNVIIITDERKAIQGSMSEDPQHKDELKICF